MLETKFNSDNFIQFMERFVAQTVKMKVVILDNCPIYKSKKFKAKIDEWKENDVLIYFLPPYSPEFEPYRNFVAWNQISMAEF